jgi:hypothetical protein
MPKPLKSASEIQRLVHERVHAIHTVIEDQAKIRVPRPYWHEEDAQGCNWNMEVFGNATGYEAEIYSVLQDIRKATNLKQ